MPRLLCIDVSNVFHRCLHGYPEMTDDAGRPVQAAYGTGATVLRLIDEHRPTHVLAARDSRRDELVRRQIWAGYKAHRPTEVDPTLPHQRELADRILEVLAIPSAAVAGWEADDVIATAARTFAGEVVIGSGDKDLLACCSPDGRVRVHLLGRDVVVDAAGVADICGVGPERLTDLKALVGDPSDGFAGVPGIGRKTAVALIEEHGSLEQILAAHAAGKLSGRAASCLAKGAEEGLRSYALAAMSEVLDIEAPAPWSCDRAAAGAALASLGMPGLAGRLARAGA